MLILVATPQRKGLGSKLLSILHSSIESGRNAGKVAVVVYSTTDAKSFYEKCGYISVGTLLSHDDISVRHRYPPLSDCINGFSETGKPLPPNDTTAMFLFLNGESVPSKYAKLDMRGKSTLIGAFIYVHLTAEVKKTLGIDELLKSHLQDAVYKSKEVYILGLVTEDRRDGRRDAWDVLICIDYKKVKDDIDKLKQFLSRKADKYVFS